jgi:rhodanese-related sulfurtransferase
MVNFVSRLFAPSHAASLVWIEIDEFRRRLANGDPVVLVDVRQPEEFNGSPGHLPNAVNVPLPELPGRVDEVAAHQKPVVLICKTDRRSARAAEALLAAGLTDVAVLRGGTDGWYQQGLPLQL